MSWENTLNPAYVRFNAVAGSHGNDAALAWLREMRFRFPDEDATRAFGAAHACESREDAQPSRPLPLSYPQPDRA